MKAPTVSVYTCGPTVYDNPHIGNWFTFIREDILIRTLTSVGYSPKWVMNITDVGHLTSDADEGEDKLEVAAKRDKTDAWSVANKYTKAFTGGLKELNFLTPSHLEKATDHIQDQIKLLTTLEDKGYTYKTRDGIYFDSSKFPNYAKLAKLDVENLRHGARVVVNPEKQHPADFALWKFSDKDSKRDMEWPSPWGVGFPGWHLECSAIAMKYLGDTIDIHCGGIDHIPVHHTNEIAQSESSTGKPFSKYWMHSNFVHIKNEKMSKSKGNFITLDDVKDKNFSLMAFRLLVLESHYRSEAQFNWDIMASAEIRHKEMLAWSDLRLQNFKSTKLSKAYKTYMTQLNDALLNDLNTPKALSVISRMIKDVEVMGIDSKAIEQASKDIDERLGLKLSAGEDITSSQKELINLRNDARKNSNWNKSDELRAKLLAEGLVLKDTIQGTSWSRL